MDDLTIQPPADADRAGLTDEAYPACAALREKRKGADGVAADIFYSSPERLSELAERPDWRVGMLVTGRVLVDRGPLAALVETTLSRAGEHAHAHSTSTTTPISTAWSAR